MFCIGLNAVVCVSFVSLSVQCSVRQFSGVRFFPLLRFSPVVQLLVGHKISIQPSFSVGLFVSSSQIVLVCSIRFVHFRLSVFYESKSEINAPVLCDQLPRLNETSACIDVAKTFTVKVTYRQ